MTKTQIYLEPDQHRSLVEEAHHRRVSLAGLVRELVALHLQQRARPTTDRRNALLGVIGLGKSGRADISRRHDEEFGDALYDDYRKHSRR